MPYSTAAKNRMLDHLISVGGISHASLHSADPADTGSGEVSGGAPAYSRRPIAFFAAAAGAIDSSTVPLFDVPAGVTVTHVGFWSAATAGTLLGSAAVPNETFAAQGSYRLDGTDMNLNG